MTTTKYNELNPMERHVLERKGTEPPFSGEYDNFYETGTYICRRSIAPRTSSTPTAAGRPSTTRCPAPSGVCPIPMASAPRSSA